MWQEKADGHAIDVERLSETRPIESPQVRAISYNGHYVKLKIYQKTLYQIFQQEV